ncbi:MAG: NifU N-terminal domain-containing protein [Candidatus Omnitrophica bacterium]|nr:NifU N-terminal domain-containing protein [Candidatus Omnitrophota bacterium]
MADPLEIVVEGTPNPNAAKFTLNRVVATQGKTYRDAAAADAPSFGKTQDGGLSEVEWPPWAKALLAIPGLVQVFAVNNFISVTKSPDAEWDILVPQVEEELKKAFSA